MLFQKYDGDSLATHTFLTLETQDRSPGWICNSMFPGYTTVSRMFARLFGGNYEKPHQYSCVFVRSYGHCVYSKSCSRKQQSKYQSVAALRNRSVDLREQRHCSSDFKHHLGFGNDGRDVFRRQPEHVCGQSHADCHFHPADLSATRVGDRQGKGRAPDRAGGTVGM
jgi:hypothetical protein